MRPLSEILRPKYIKDIIGQKHIIDIMQAMIDSNSIKSMILCGDPGTGKTSIARCLANEIDGRFIELNAGNSGIKDLRNVIETSKNIDQQTILFVDEIHKWAKNIQNTLLSYVEDNTIIFIGATTEKPQFAAIKGLLSRILHYETTKLSNTEMAQGILKITKHYKDSPLICKKESILRLINRCNGDLRKLYNVVDVIISIIPEDGVINNNLIDAVIPNKHFNFDRNGNEHFDLAAAWQNSVQNSDADQAIYFLAKWLLSGEDPVYIARRILISASEDACSNPNAAMIANNAYIAAKEIGYPECKIPMAHATIEIANSARDKTANNAIAAAIYDIKNNEEIIDLGNMRAGNHDGYSKVVTKKYV